MISVLLVIQVFVTIALIGIVLIQRSEGGGLGLGSGQGMGSFMSGRGTANLLTRTTAVLATLFMALSLVLALLYKHGGEGATSILNTPPAATAGKTPINTAPALPPIPGEAQPATTNPAPATAPANGAVSGAANGVGNSPNVPSSDTLPNSASSSSAPASTMPASPSSLSPGDAPNLAPGQAGPDHPAAPPETAAPAGNPPAPGTTGSGADGPDSTSSTH